MADLAQSSWEQFCRLCDAASATPEGKGGVAALQGFSFQFLVSLEAMVRASSGDQADHVFLEKLSDLAVAHGDHIVVAQIKRTLSSSAVGKGLEDLWTVDQLAHRHTPELAGMLRYKLLGSKSELVEIDRKLGSWKPEGGGDEERLKRFRARLSWEIAPNPLLALATSLVNALGVSNPFALIEAWLGKLLKAPSREGLADAAAQIAIEMRGLEAGQRLLEARFRLWSTEDQPPAKVIRETDTSKAVLTGQMPDRGDLRAGRFAPRSLYDTILSDAEAWLVENVPADRELLRAFWISGRSGTGKSVSLLHLLSSLHETDSSRVIIWLEGDSWRVGQAIQWSRPYVAEGYQIIIAVDDPYTAVRQSDLDAALTEARSEIESMLELYPGALRPMLMFCGPDEQSDAFEQEFGSQVRTRVFTLPPETEDDIGELREWYRERTGRTRLPLQETSNVLIVQLFFEWATGEKIGDFAKRFRQRLEDLLPTIERGPFQLVAEILALNRLYALYPRGALDSELDTRPELGSAFDRLEDNRHFSFVPHLGGYRLTHPHLADAIYRSWFGGAADKRHRKLHLKRGILAAIDHGETPSQKFYPLWAISRLAEGSSHLSRDNADRIALIRDELVDVLSDVYREKFSHPQPSLAELPVWVNLDKIFELNLSPSPLLTMVEKLKSTPVDAQGLRLACHTIIRRHQDYPEGLEAVKAILQQNSAWKEWPKVAMDYVRRQGLIDIAADLATFAKDRPREARELINFVLHRRLFDYEIFGRDIIIAWFQVSAPYLEYQAGFLTDFIDRWGCENEIFDIGFDLLSRFPTHPSWSHVWERLRTGRDEHQPRLRALGRSWLDDFDEGKRGWGWVWSSLFSSSEAEREDLGLLCRRWLEWADPSESSWSRAWETVWAAGDKDIELRLLGLSWLNDVQRGNRSWIFVWKPLWSHHKGEQDLRQVALDWLNEAFENPSWKYVWELLWEHEPGADDLRQLALEWLREVSRNSLPWQSVWKPLWDHDPGAEDLRQVALDWLGEAFEHPSWKHVWELLWGREKGAQDLRQVALDWLKETFEHPSWKYVWEPLWDHDRGAQDLRQVALDWLNEVPREHLSWQATWMLLWTETAGAAELRKVASDWLKEAPRDHPSWRFAWEPLWEHEPGADDLRQLALQWLREVPRNSLQWQSVWKALWDHDPGAEDLRQVALDWLGEAFEHPSWKHVWELLWGREKGAQDLRQVALDWLKETFEHPSWKYVWEPLWDHDRGAQDLRQVAFLWLNEAFDHPSWKYVWEPLWNYDTGAEDLRQVALDWLKEAFEHGSWSFVWELLWTESAHADPELATIANDWLEQVNPFHRSWGFVWHALWRSPAVVQASSGALIDLAIDWLSAEKVAASCWPKVWKFLWHGGHGDTAALRQIGSNLLDKHPPRLVSNIRSLLASPRPTERNPDSRWSDQWKKSWSSAEQSDDRTALFREGMVWIADVGLEHSGWANVWTILWADRQTTREATEVLKASAMKWLGKVDREHTRWSQIWLKLWQDPIADHTPLLTQNGLAWLEGSGIRWGWTDVWLALWQSEVQCEALRAVVESGSRRADFESRACPEVRASLETQ